MYYFILLTIVWENSKGKKNLLFIFPAVPSKLVPFNSKTNTRKPVKRCHRQFGITENTLVLLLRQIFCVLQCCCFWIAFLNLKKHCQVLILQVYLWLEFHCNLYLKKVFLEHTSFFLKVHNICFLVSGNYHCLAVVLTRKSIV